MVYQVPADFTVDDGQDREARNAVEACDLVAVVEVRDQVEEG